MSFLGSMELDPQYMALYVVAAILSTIGLAILFRESRARKKALEEEKAAFEAEKEAQAKEREKRAKRAAKSPSGRGASVISTAKSAPYSLGVRRMPSVIGLTYMTYLQFFTECAISPISSAGSRLPK